jgi:hypothetical protein
MSTWKDAILTALSNVWAPIGSTYHWLAIDTPAIAMSHCGLVVSSARRIPVDPEKQLDTEVHPGVCCAQCRLRRYFPDHVEALQ